jgi:mono/diheme cytochrome c family protein
VTEIPEHLLKRSKERRAAIGDADAGAEEPAAAPAGEAVEATPAAAPAPAAAAAIVEPEPPAPEPVRPEVEAALRRKKIPIWAMPVLAALPLWAYVYQATLEPAPTGELTPLEAGEAVYGSSGCASCHGASGGGTSTAPGFDGVLETWPDLRDHMMWVRVGNDGWFAASGEDVYGATAKASNGGKMPAFPLLTDQELAEVVLYERVEFGGMEESGEEYELLLSIAEGTTTFADAGLGELSAAAGIDEATLAPGG